MSTDEQRVRTVCGWIGVEISRSRVRTPGKAGFGLYRVRGSRPIARAVGTLGRDMKSCEWAEWTAYAFTLEEIEREVEVSIQAGTPAGPSALTLRLTGASLCEWNTVPTRWTSAYRGLRDLGARGVTGLCGRPDRHEDGCLCLADRKARWLPDGEPMDVTLKPEATAELDAAAALVDAGLVRMTHVEGCLCDDDRYTAACMRASGTVRQRQREQNREFQAEHLKRREHGLKARHAAKLARNETQRRETGPPAQA